MIVALHQHFDAMQILSSAFHSQAWQLPSLRSFRSHANPCLVSLYAQQSGTCSQFWNFSHGQPHILQQLFTQPAYGQSAQLVSSLRITASVLLQKWPRQGTKTAFLQAPPPARVCRADSVTPAGVRIGMTASGSMLRQSTWVLLCPLRWLASFQARHSTVRLFWFTLLSSVSEMHHGYAQWQQIPSRP